MIYDVSQNQEKILLADALKYNDINSS